MGWSLASLLAHGEAAPLLAQDTIISRAPEDGTLITRRGTILEWRGAEVVIDSVGGPKRIPNARVVEFHTTWCPAYDVARTLMERRQFQEAVPSLVAAMNDEPRPWARHIIRSDLIRCLSLAGQDLAAGQQFVELMGEDPQSRFFWTIPLAWGTVSHDLHLAAAAQQWLGARHPAISLLGASWLLSFPERDQALKTLDTLSRDIDPLVAHLASAQLWQTRVMEADARQLERWQAQIERMPMNIRPGPRLVIAEGYLRLGRHDEALLEWMKNVILSDDQYRLSLASLEKSAAVLRSQAKEHEAQRLLEEIVREFPGTAASAEAQRLLTTRSP